MKLKHKSTNYIDDLITEAIELLAEDDITNGTGSLMELAEAFHKSQLGMDSFLNVRSYIIDAAIKKGPAKLIFEKVSIAEIKRKEDRNGNPTRLN